jgi:hypothetical protein
MTKTINEVASMGGKTVLQKYGKEHFVEMGRRGASAIKAKYGQDYYKRIRRGEKIKIAS